MSELVRVTTPSRLHFGLLRFAQETGPSFGGLGMMIDRPRYVLEISASKQLTATGPDADRAQQFALSAFNNCSGLLASPVSIQITEAPPSHTGLGTGTQLALAVASGIQKLSNASSQSVSTLAKTVGRGARSAIGTYGFDSGGMIWETGISSDASLGCLAKRLEFPAEWRVLLIRPEHQQGKSGQDEKSAFRSLPPVASEVTERLIHLAEHKILPAAEAEDFSTFSEALFQYGQLAGSCFESVQGGPYASAQIHKLIQHLRKLDISGVGQSSWGPTIFAMCESADKASELHMQLAEHPDFAICDFQIACPNNTGAMIETIELKVLN